MKFLLLIFILFVHYSQCQSTEDELKKIGKTFPKKVRIGLLQFNNAGKYVKTSTKYEKKVKAPNREGVDGSLKNYTVFPKPFPGAGQELMIDQIVPDSPYFPVDTPLPSERKSRVKKVLPKYVARVKRSTDDKKETKSNKNVNVKKNKAPRSVKNVKSLGSNNAKKGRSHDHKKQRGLSQSNNRNRTLSKIGKQKLSNVPLHHTREKKPRSKIVKKITNAHGSAVRKLKNVRNTQKNFSRPERVRSSKKKPVKSRKDPDARRLIAGRDALIEEYPYAVSIQKDKQHWCSGAILNQKMVITTANCMWRSKSISRMHVRAGSRHTDRGGQLMRIQEVMKHPGWKVRRDPDNDIALVLVDRNIRFSHAVHSVDLPNRVMMPAFDDAWITSWGAERRDGIFDAHDGMTLQVYHARLLERDKCNNLTQRFGVSVTENFICLAQTGRRAPCTRDTGAPAVSDGVLWGMASWGIRKLCGTERFPAMFSYLASQSNMDFVINATHYLMSDDRQYPFLDRYPVPRYPLTTPTPMTMPY